MTKNPGQPVAGGNYPRAMVDRQLQALHEMELLICREEELVAGLPGCEISSTNSGSV